MVLDGSLHYVQYIPYAAILQIFLLFSMIWDCRIKSPGRRRECEDIGESREILEL